MLKELVILVVEDSNSVIETYQEMIESYNRHSEKYKVSIDSVVSLEEALEKLNVLDKSYIGAVIDLDLAHSNGEDQSGKKVIDFIKKNLRLPVYVISSTTFNLTVEESIQNDLYKVFDRDDEYDFIEDFIKINSTGITDILNRTGKIEEFINTIYWNHLSTSLLPWIEDDIRTEEDKKQSLIRYCIMHLQEYLDLSATNNGAFSDYYPAEFFITGPIKESIFTGDIFIYEKQRYVVVTPACDFANRNISKLICLRISELSEVNESFDAESKDDKVKNKLRPYILNQKPRYHFVPQLNYRGNVYNAGIIDFQDQVTFNYKDILKSDIERFATISQPFLKDLIERRSSYYSRQGAPNLSRNQLFKMHLD